MNEELDNSAEMAEMLAQALREAGIEVVTSGDIAKEWMQTNGPGLSQTH